MGAGQFAGLGVNAGAAAPTMKRKNQSFAQAIAAFKCGRLQTDGNDLLKLNRQGRGQTILARAKRLLHLTVVSMPGNGVIAFRIAAARDSVDM